MLSNISLPKTGWLHTYMKYTGGLTPEKVEIPPEFNLFTGIATIAATLQRNTFVPRGLYNIYPAMLVVLIAPTGKGKKTTAINLGQALLKRVNKVRVISEQITPEALVLALARKGPVLQKGQIMQEDRDSTGLLILPELSVFLEKRDYKSGLVPLITRLADAPDDWGSETICRGEVELHNVALSMLGGTAPSWLVGSVPVEAFTGGFMARFLFIISEGAKHPVAAPMALDADLQQELVLGLRDMHKLYGPVAFSPAAEELYAAWYSHVFKNKSADAKKAAYQERKHDHASRLSMVFAVSDKRMIIEPEDLQLAIDLLDINERGMFGMFGELERGQTTSGEIIQACLTVIKRRGKIKRTDLMRSVVSQGITAAQITEAVDSLAQASMIKIERQTVGGKKPTTFYQYLQDDPNHL